MFFITFSLLWAFTFFLLLLYIVSIFSIIFYVLSQARSWIYPPFFKQQPQNQYLQNNDLNLLFLTFILFLLLITLSWTSPTIAPWFGHLIFGSLQKKFLFFTLFFFAFALLFFSSHFVFGSQELSDYYSTCFTFYIWLFFLFCTNTLFSVIFMIEILSTLSFLLSVTSTFSSSYFHNNTDFNSYTRQTPLPSLPYFQGLFYFFWISLLASLSLFFFMLVFYTQLVTMDVNFTEFAIIFLLINTASQITISTFLGCSFIIFSVFLKCGLVPFYFWKPIFTKSLPLHALFFYVFIFYFLIFVFFVLFFFLNYNELLYIFGLIFNTFLLIGFFSLFAILTEAYYIKIFLALSSILNTLLVFLIFANEAHSFFF